MPIELWAPIVLVAITGLTWVAYNHPKGYSKIFLAITSLTFVTFAGFAIWNIALLVAGRQLSPMINHDKSAAANKAIEAISIPNGWLVFFTVAFLIYLMFLLYLHEIIGPKNP